MKKALFIGFIFLFSNAFAVEQSRLEHSRWEDNPLNTTVSLTLLPNDVFTLVYNTSGNTNTHAGRWWITTQKPNILNLKTGTTRINIKILTNEHGEVFGLKMPDGKKTTTLNRASDIPVAIPTDSTEPSLENTTWVFERDLDGKASNPKIPLKERFQIYFSYLLRDHYLKWHMDHMIINKKTGDSIPSEPSDDMLSPSLDASGYVSAVIGNLVFLTSKKGKETFVYQMEYMVKPTSLPKKPFSPNINVRLRALIPVPGTELPIELQGDRGMPFEAFDLYRELLSTKPMLYNTIWRTERLGLKNQLGLTIFPDGRWALDKQEGTNHRSIASGDRINLFPETDTDEVRGELRLLSEVTDSPPIILNWYFNREGHIILDAVTRPLPKGSSFKLRGRAIVPRQLGSMLESSSSTGDCGKKLGKMGRRKS